MILSKSARLLFANWYDVVSNFRGATNVDVISHVSAREIFRELRSLGVVFLVYEGGRVHSIDVANDEVIDFLIRAAEYEMALSGQKGRARSGSPLPRKRWFER